MKKLILIALMRTCLASSISAQTVSAQKDFEGVLTYRDNVESKLEGVSNVTWKKILNLAGQMTISVKNGNFKQVSDRLEAYVFSDKGKCFFKIKGYDTLYYQDITSDTSTVKSVSKLNDKKIIAGYNCNSINVLTSAGSYTYFYSPTIYVNPKTTQNYKLDREDIFYKETSSIYLGLQQETSSFILTSNCVKVEPKAVDATEFDLPNLPQEKFSPASFLKLPVFAGTEGFQTFISKRADATEVAKYLKIGRKESSSTQTVYVSFMVSETGNVYNAVVQNKKDVHPKVAEEAIRLINISHWRPATVFGQTIPYKLEQPITFQVNAN